MPSSATRLNSSYSSLLICLPSSSILPGSDASSDATRQHCGTLATAWVRLCMNSRIWPIQAESTPAITRTNQSTSSNRISTPSPSALASLSRLSITPVAGGVARSVPSSLSSFMPAGPASCQAIALQGILIVATLPSGAVTSMPFSASKRSNTTEATRALGKPPSSAQCALNCCTAGISGRAAGSRTRCTSVISECVLPPPKVMCSWRTAFSDFPERRCVTSRARSRSLTVG